MEHVYKLVNHLYYKYDEIKNYFSFNFEMMNNKAKLRLCTKIQYCNQTFGPKSTTNKDVTASLNKCQI